MFSLLSVFAATDAAGSVGLWVWVRSALSSLSALLPALLGLGLALRVRVSQTLTLIMPESRA